MEPICYCVAIYTPIVTVTSTRIDILQPEYEVNYDTLKPGPDTGTPNNDSNAIGKP